MSCPVEQRLQGQLEIISGIKLRWYDPTEAQENGNQDAENKTRCKETQREATLSTPGRKGCCVEHSRKDTERRASLKRGF